MCIVVEIKNDILYSNLGPIIRGLVRSNLEIFKQINFKIGILKGVYTKQFADVPFLLTKTNFKI